jgi:hypothetical protein
MIMKDWYKSLSGNERQTLVRHIIYTEKSEISVCFATIQLVLIH